MPINTTYTAPNINSLDSSKVKKDDNCVMGYAILGTTTNFDLTNADHDRMILGGELCVLDAVDGDWVKFQVLAPNNTVVDEFIPMRGIMRDRYQTQISARFPAKVPAGFKFRTIYTSVGSTTQPYVIVNFDLNKVLV